MVVGGTYGDCPIHTLPRNRKRLVTKKKKTPRTLTSAKRERKAKKSLNRQADKLWADTVKKPGYCLKCLRRPPQVVLHAAHIKPKGKFRNHHLRCDPLDGIPLCYACHLYWAHKDPLGFVAWLEDEIPGRILYLTSEAQIIKKFDPTRAIEELGQ